MSEAAARHKIDQLLENAGWRFFDDDNGPANIRLEAHVALKRDDLDSLGDDFERSGRGFVDFMLIDDRGFPFPRQAAPSRCGGSARNLARDIGEGL